ncbi:MAG: DEAD/DEAH box helicase family protein, partial [Candidatus Methanomethylicaceae archaeon]
QFVTADLFRVEREGQEESFESIAEIMRTASDEGVRDFVISTGANDPDTVLSILVHRFGKNQSLPVGTPEEERQAFEGLSAGIYISAQMAASQGGAVNLTLGTNERGPVRVRIKPEEQITNADGTPRVDRRGLPMFRFTVEVFRQDRRGRQYSEAIVRTGRVADAGQQYVRRRGERVAARATAEGAAQSQQTARGGARAQEIVQRAEYAPANLAEEAIEDIRQLPIPERMGAFYSHLSQDAEQQQFNTGRSGRTPTAEQREYITRIMSGVAEGRRMIASLHTGWGKTSIIGAITSMGQERAAAQAGVRSRLNIVITPNTALSEELTKVLREQYGVNAIKHVADPGLRSELIPDWEERNRQYQAYRRQVFASLNQMVWQNKDLTLVMTPEAFSNFSKSQVGRFSIWSMLDRGVNVIIDEAQEITRETGRPFHLIREGIENIEAEFARVSSEAKVGVALVGGTMTDPVLDAISQFFGVNEEDILKKRLPLSYLSKRIEPLKESETISNRVLHRVRTAFEEGKDSILVFGGRIQDIHDITNKLQSELGEDVVVKYFHGGIIPNTADEENIGRKMSLEERREVQELMENRQAREQGKKYVFVASDIAQLGLNPDVNEVIVAGDYLAFGDLLQKGARIRPRRDEQGNILPNVIAGNFSMLVNPKRIIDIGNRLQLQAQDQNILQTVFTEIYRKIQEEFENLDPNWQVAGEQMENIASQVIDDFNRARREVNPNATTISRFAAGAMLRAMRESGLLSMQLVSEPVSEEQQEQLRQMAERGFIEPGSEPPKHLAFHLENVTNPIEHAQNSNIYVNPSNPNETISFVEYLSKLVEGRGREIKATGELLRNILISKSDENREVMWQNAERAFFSGDVQGLEDYVYQQMPRELAKEYVDEVRKSIRTFQENTENLSDLTESFARLKKEIDDLTEHYAQAGSEFKNAAITQLSEVLQSDLGSENLSRIAGLGEIASISVGNEGLTLMSTGGQFADLPISRPEATAGIGGAFYALGRVSSLGTADFERLRFASTGGGGGGGFGGFGGGWGGGRGGDYIPRRGGFWSAGLGPLVYAPYLLNRFARMLIAPIVAEGESYGELATSYLGLQYQSTSPSFLHQFAGRMEATAIRRGAALYPAIEPFDRIKEWASRRPGLVIAGSSLNVGAEALAGMFIATQSVSFFGGQVADVLFKNAAEIAQTQL